MRWLGEEKIKNQKTAYFSFPSAAFGLGLLHHGSTEAGMQPKWSMLPYTEEAPSSALLHFLLHHLPNVYVKNSKGENPTMLYTLLKCKILFVL